MLLLRDVFPAACRTYYGNWMLSPDIKSASSLENRLLNYS